jgi:chemotaxis protein MotB
MDDKPKKIIIKQVKKGHEGGHGGSWKVAYADFVTALMAFFLLMWLLNMTSQEKRAVLALYFKHFSLFTQGGKSFMMAGGPSPNMEQSGGSEMVDSGESAGGVTNEESLSRIIAGMGQQEKGNAEKDQILIGTSAEGIRIQIVDTVENPIFPPGSDRMTDGGKKIIKDIVNIIKFFPNEIIIEGHTDAAPVRNQQVSNWELSTARASSARREFETDGIDPNRIAMVAGFADKVPLFKDNPEDPRNRRISILFMKGKKPKPPDKFEWLLKKPEPLLPPQPQAQPQAQTQPQRR